MIEAQTMPGQTVRAIRLKTINAAALKKSDFRSWNAPA
jgi:hypothetical protein